MLGLPICMAPELPPLRCLEGVRKKFQMTCFPLHYIISLIKSLPKLIPGLTDVGVPHEDGDGSRTPPICMEGVWKKCQITSFITTLISSMNYALTSVPGLADVRVPHGDGDGTRALAPGSGSKMCAYDVDQNEKLKGLDV